MHFIYITAKTYPGNTADHHYIRQLSQGFAKVLGNDMQFIARGDTRDFKGVNYLRLPQIRWIKSSIFFVFWILFFSIKSLKKLKDMVFFSNDSYLLTILIIWKKILGFKYKICSDWHHLFYDWRDKFIASNSDALITTSNKLKKNIIDNTRVGEGMISAIYGGVDMDLYSGLQENLRLKLGLPEDKIIVGYVGLFKTFGLEKGIVTMIEALKNLPEKFVMAFVGGTPAEIKEYSAYADSFGVMGRCLFVGRKKGNEIATYQMAMDILAIPYPNQPHFRESGFPMKVYEYMASKKPILYSRLDLVEEILSDCGIGFIADDPADFSLRAKEIAENNFYPELVSVAYLKLKKYTWDEKARRIIDFIKQKCRKKSFI